MKTTSLLLPAILLLLPVAGAEPATGNLFAGKDLKENFDTEGNWKLGDDGVVSLHPREGESGWKRYGSYLWVKGEFADFAAEVEFKFGKGGNSGFHFRCSDLVDPVTHGIEVQILDSHGKPADKMSHHDNGGIIRTAPPTSNASKPAGEWNKLKVTAKGNHIKVVLNGTLVQDIDLSKTESKDKPKKGRIGLQDHGQVIHFRNFKLKSLDK